MRNCQRINTKIKIKFYFIFSDRECFKRIEQNNYITWRKLTDVQRLLSVIWQAFWTLKYAIKFLQPVCDMAALSASETNSLSGKSQLEDSNTHINSVVASSELNKWHE